MKRSRGFENPLARTLKSGAGTDQTVASTNMVLKMSKLQWTACLTLVAGRPIPSPIPSLAGLALRFNIPTVANGHVYVGAKREDDVYGLLSQEKARK
jgi:hypothetical protein